jgi:site-specific DNA-cytosine methylase
MKTRSDRPWRSLHLCGGSGGGGLGALRAGMPGRSIDIDPGACRNFEKLTGQQALCTDITKMKPGDLRDFDGDEAPDVVLTSSPCKGFSRCMGEEKAETEHYQNLNQIAVDSVHLALSTWRRPPPIVFFEMVPGIKTKKNRPFLERVVKMFQKHGYSVDERTHNCGEWGELGQNRWRVLLAARHMEQVPNFIRMPPVRRVRGIGEVIGRLPVPAPGSTEGGPMHRLPKMIPMNWVRLALIRAGKDWRDLPPEVRLRERAARQNGGFGVNDWEEPSHTVLAEGTVRNTWAAVADPRVGCKRRDGGHGVRAWDQPSACIIAEPCIDNWPLGVADPRIADPRLGCEPRNGAYGVVGWAEPSHTVLAHHSHDNTAGSVADPRVPEVVGPPFAIDSRSPCHMVIEAADGTWHRPMTTLELAALQGFPVWDDATGWLELDGESHEQWRTWIGDAIPIDTAEAMFRAAIEALTEARDGFRLVGDGGIWVRPERLAA